MREPTGSAGQSATDEDQAIRDQVRAVTNQILQQGRVDPEALRNVVRTLAGQQTGHAAPDRAEARERFADVVRGLDEALQKSAAATHEALQRLASRGKDYTDNDLKDMLVSLRTLEEHYVAATSRIAEAMSDTLRSEVMGLAAHAAVVHGSGVRAQCPRPRSGLMRCGRTPGVPAPACGSGPGPPRPSPSPDAHPYASAARPRSRA